jgi:hypothetical protein
MAHIIYFIPRNTLIGFSQYAKVSEWRAMKFLMLNAFVNSSRIAIGMDGSANPFTKALGKKLSIGVR